MRVQALVDEWRGDEEGKQRRVAAMKARPFSFRSYDPAVTRLYAQQYPWIAASNRVVVCTRKTAMSLELAHLMKRLMTSGKARYLKNRERGVVYAVLSTAGVPTLEVPSSHPIPTLSCVFFREQDLAPTI